MQETDIILAVQYLILCTMKHTLVPTFPTNTEYIKIPIIQELSQKHSITPRLLENTLLPGLFLDLDLSILGSSDHEYDLYAKQIRKEYNSYSTEEYRIGRITVLRGFLNRERLYFTDYFYGKYESRARRNIEREISSLQEGGVEEIAVRLLKTSLEDTM